MDQKRFARWLSVVSRAGRLSQSRRSLLEQRGRPERERRLAANERMLESRSRNGTAHSNDGRLLRAEKGAESASGAGWDLLWAGDSRSLQGRIYEVERGGCGFAFSR